MPKAPLDDLWPVFYPEIRREQGEGFTQRGRRGRDQPREAQLVGGGSDSLAQLVVSHFRMKDCVGQAESGARGVRSKVQHIWHVDTASQKATLQDARRQGLLLIHLVLD